MDINPATLSREARKALITVLDAMRDPDWRMLCAGWRVEPDGPYPGHTYTAMIDALIEEVRAQK